MDYRGAIIYSGEGYYGIYERHTGKPTLAAINRRLVRERSGGDRWAVAYVPAGPEYIPDTYVNIETGRMITIMPEEIDY